MEVNTRCPMCERLNEDCGHLFFKCKKAKEYERRLNLEEISAETIPMPRTGTGGWGLVARDSEGMFLEGGYGAMPRAANSVQCEVLAAQHSLVRIHQLWGCP
uniref:RNase H type-1 domain-containing protein n=1 Tax=Leersia perrieri TaxID=77586 RepID=A0A0D9XUM4_9ORYZ